MRRRILVLPLFLGLVLLFPPPAPAQEIEPPARPDDGLLRRPDLQRIVDLGIARDGAALTDRLADPDPLVRARAAFALASVQDSNAVPVLLALLDHPEAVVRADAAFALGQSPPGLRAAPLVEALRTEQDPDVLRLILEALGKQGDRASLDSLTAWTPPSALRGDLALAVGRYALRGVHAPQAVDTLVARLDDPETAVRERAAYYFGRTRDAGAWARRAGAVRERLDAMAFDDPAAMHLLRGLGQLGDPQDTPRLITWADEATDWRLRLNAVRALADRTGESRVRVALLGLLFDASEHVAIAAAEVLGSAEPWTPSETGAVRRWIERRPADWRITTPLLKGLIRHGETDFVLAEIDRRRSAGEVVPYAASLGSLAFVSRRGALEQLVDAARDEDVEVSYQALQSLASRWPTDRADLALPGTYYQALASGIRRRDLATVYAAAPVLSDTLFRPFGATRLLAETLTSLEAPRDLEAMLALVDALGRTRDPAAQPALRQALEHDHPMVRRAAASALARLTDTPAAPDTLSVPPAEKSVDWQRLRALGPYPSLRLETDKGPVTLRLDATQAPLTVQTLTDLAAGGTFDGVPFHRVVGNFVVQGGDVSRGDGFGGPGFSIRSEFTRIPYVRGTAGMASAGKDTEGSQFFVTHSMQPHLDGSYTAFGWVTDGMGVVDRLYEGDRIRRAVVVPDETTY